MYFFVMMTLVARKKYNMSNVERPSLLRQILLFCSSYLATDSTSNLLLALQSRKITCGGWPSRLAVVQLFKMASEVKEVGGGNTSTPSLSHAHLMALQACECFARPS